MIAKTLRYQPGHLDFFTPKEIFNVEIDHQKEKLNNFTYTLVVNSEVIAVFGLKQMWTGVAEIWALTSELVHKYPVHFHKECLKLIKTHGDVLELHRVQCSVRADYPEGLKWIESMGFKKEGLMEKYGPNKMDYYLYARELIWP